MACAYCLRQLLKYVSFGDEDEAIRLGGPKPDCVEGDRWRARWLSARIDAQRRANLN